MGQQGQQGQQDPRVLLDATAVPADRGGVGRYVDALLDALARAGADLVVACQSSDVDHYGGLAPGAKVVAAPPAVARRAARFAWEQVGLPGLVRATGAEVLHSPHYTLPLRSPVPVLATLHDATFFSDPGYHSPVKARFFRSWTRVALRRAARCLVPSAATRDELVRLAGADPARLVVAHHGVDHALFHPPSAAEVEAVAASLGLEPGAWVAFLGTIEPRKNVPSLVRGWGIAVGDLDDPPALVLAGAPGWDHDVDGAIAAVASVSPGLRVLRPGYLPLEQLRALLGGARVVAYPSHGEGFGLPVLEAMACAAPVLTTRRLALPEVGGDAVAYTGTSAQEIGTALRSLLADADRRAHLASAGQERAVGFTWERTAQTHLQAYAAVARR